MLIGPKDGIGGHVTYVVDILKFGLEGFEIHVMNTARDKRLMKRHPESGAFVFSKTDVVSIVRAGFQAFFNIFRCLGRLLFKRPDIVLLTGGRNLIWEQSWFILFCEILRIPVALHYHGPFYLFWEESGEWMRHIIKLFYGRLDRMMVLSKRDYECALKVLNEERVVIVPNYIDPGEYSLVYDRQTPGQNGRIGFLFLGGLNPWRKGMEVLNKAIDDLESDNLPLHFVYTGSEKMVKCIDSQVRNGNRKWVEFAGWITGEQKRQFYQELDVMVLPSFNEGLPYALIEAMASGMAVISTDIGGIPDLIPSEDHGYVIPAGDAEALKKCLLALAGDKEKIKRMGINNIERIKQLYTQEIIFARIAKELASL